MLCQASDWSSWGGQQLEAAACTTLVHSTGKSAQKFSLQYEGGSMREDTKIQPRAATGDHMWGHICWG